MKFWGLLAAVSVAQASLALDVSVPEAAIEIENLSYSQPTTIPTGPMIGSTIPKQSFQGATRRQAWRIEDTNNSLGILRAMQANYERQGFAINFECAAATCGGYDFRYALETAPPPDLLVALDGYHYVSLVKNFEHVTLLASSVDGASYVQQLYVIASDEEVRLVDTNTLPQQADLATNDENRWTIQGVSFEQGSSKIIDVPTNQLKIIADRMKEDSNTTAYIVGHSDQSGSLSANINISRARAESVRKLLINDFAISANQIFADGVGFLAPIATNATEEGRKANRRVEVVFLIN